MIIPREDEREYRGFAKERVFHSTSFSQFGPTRVDRSFRQHDHSGAADERHSNGGRNTPKSAVRFGRCLDRRAVHEVPIPV